MRMQCGKLWTPSSVGWRRKKKRENASSGWVAVLGLLPSGLRLQHTWQHGRMPGRFFNIFAESCVVLLASRGGVLLPALLPSAWALMRSERAWVRVAGVAVSLDGQVVPQQWLAHTTAPQVNTIDKRRLDLVIYGATPLGGALCCDAPFVSVHAHGRRLMTPLCGLRNAENGRRTRSSARVARSSSWS